MTKTVTDYSFLLKSKPLYSYKLFELQIALHKIESYYRRFKHETDREELNALWNKVVEQYNTLLKKQYPMIENIYSIDYLKTL